MVRGKVNPLIEKGRPAPMAWHSQNDVATRDKQLPKQNEGAQGVFQMFQYFEHTNDVIPWTILSAQKILD
jgi:hypothetical protein